MKRAWTVVTIALFATSCEKVPDLEVEPAYEDEYIDALEDAGPSISKEQSVYMRDKIKIYEINAGYQDSLLDGRVPGLTFKIKNEGDKTLDRVAVRAVFKDAEGNPIAEENYVPVIAGGYDPDPPLRPGYIWQNEQGTFLTAKSVPSEWDGASVSLSVTDIDFGTGN